MDQMRRTAFLGLGVALVCFGCGSGSSYPPAQDGGRTDTGGGGGDSSTTTDTGQPADAGPPPVTSTGTVRLFTGLSLLIGCTFEPDATTDRWCAFIAESSVSPSGIDLFVVNVSKAA